MERRFRTVEPWSGSFTAPRDGSLAHAGAAELAAHDPSSLVRRLAPVLRRLRTRVFVSSGTEDPGGAHAARAFTRELPLSGSRTGSGSVPAGTTAACGAASSQRRCATPCRSTVWATRGG
jgi:hypothetical protein